VSLVHGAAVCQTDGASLRRRGSKAVAHGERSEPSMLIALVALTTSFIATSDPRQHEDNIVTLARETGGAALVVDLHCPVFGTADLTKQADVVVHGNIEGVRNRLSFDERTVVTEYELRPSRILKGSAVSSRPGPLTEESFRAVVPGGRVFHEGLEISVDVNVFPEAERFQRGEEVVLFLTAHEFEPGIYRIGGCGSGGFRVVDGRVVAMLRSVAVRRGDTPKRSPRFSGGCSALSRRPCGCGEAKPKANLKSDAFDGPQRGLVLPTTANSLRTSA
jgi:hypothetical protein